MKSGRRFINIRYTKTCIAVMAAIISVTPVLITSGSLQAPVKTVPEIVGSTSSLGQSGELREPQHHLSNDELAALTVYYEAAGESFAGKLAVAAVIRNRMKLKYHSDGTVKGTVLRYKQFQPWNTRSPYHVPLDLGKKSMRDCLLAWRLVQDGRKVVDGAVLFYNPSLVRTPYWAKVSRKVTTIGGHEFYIPSTWQT